LNADRTVFEEALDTPQRVTEQFVRTVLGSFLFQGDDIFKKVRVLSGGEKSRLALVKLLLDPPNLLLMDEPTTHLDMASIDALVDALDQFEGTLIFISHDVYFIRALANRVVHVNAGKLTIYPGDYQYYIDKTAAVIRTLPAQAATRPAANPKKEQKRLEAEQRQALSRQRREQQGLVKELERRIHELEQRQIELAAELEKPETYEKSGLVMQLNRELTHVTDDLQRLGGEWESAASKLAQLEAS